MVYAVCARRVRVDPFVLTVNCATRCRSPPPFLHCLTSHTAVGERVGGREAPGPAEGGSASSNQEDARGAGEECVCVCVWPVGDMPCTFATCMSQAVKQVVYSVAGCPGSGPPPASCLAPTMRPILPTLAAAPRTLHTRARARTHTHTHTHRAVTRRLWTVG